MWIGSLGGRLVRFRASALPHVFSTSKRAVTLVLCSAAWAYGEIGSRSRLRPCVLIDSEFESRLAHSNTENALVAGMADATSSNLVVQQDVWVRIPPGAPGRSLLSDALGNEV